MKTVSKKLLSLLLVVLLLAAAIPFQAFATGTAYQVKVTIRNTDGNGKLGEVTLDASTENPVTKSQLDTAVLNKIGDSWTISKYYNAAGSEELTLVNDTDALDAGILGITVKVTSNQPEEPEPETYITLTLDAVGGKIGDTNASTTDLKLTKDSSGKAVVAELPTASKSGYKFLGWYVGDNQIENGDKLESDTTATAKYELLTKNLLVKGVKTSEKLENAKLISEYNVAEKTPLLDFLKSSDVTAAVKNSVPTGYQLKNNNGSILWYNFSGDALTSQDQATNVAQTVLVKYEPKSYTLYFKANGGTVSESSKTVTYDAKVGTLPTPTKSGDQFMGWFDESGNEYTKDTVYKVDGDTTLTAKWQSEAMVLLRIYLSPNTTTADRIVDITGKVVGNSVTQSEVEKIVKTYYTGTNMKLVGLFNDATWADYKAGSITKGDPNVTVQDTAKTNVYVVVKNATNKANSNTTTSATKAADKDNPKTGDSMAIYVASGVMVAAAAALVVVQVLRKKKHC